MYTKEEEIKVINDLFINYATFQKEIIEFLESDKQRKYMYSGMLVSCRKKLEKCNQILNSFKNINMCFMQAYTEDQLQHGGIAEQRAKVGRRLFFELKKDPTYQSIMMEIAHNRYFSNEDELLSSIKLPEDIIDEQLESMFKWGSINKEQLILYDNYFTYLLQDQDYIEIVNQNIQSNSHRTI